MERGGHDAERAADTRNPEVIYRVTSVLDRDEYVTAKSWAAELSIDVTYLLRELLADREAEYQRWKANASMLAREVRANS